jgi:hypothetical protein
VSRRLLRQLLCRRLLVVLAALGRIGRMGRRGVVGVDVGVDVGDILLWQSMKLGIRHDRWIATALAVALAVVPGWHGAVVLRVMRWCAALGVCCWSRREWVNTARLLMAWSHE